MSTPRNPSPATAAARTVGAFSPTPPVNTSTSSPPRPATIAAIAGPQPVQVDVEGERGCPLAPATGVHHRRHVGGARQGEQARPVLQRVRHRLRLEAVVGDQPQHGAGVDGARPGGHHQSLQRGEAHRGVDATAVVHRRQGGARTEVAGDEAAGVPDGRGRPPGRVGVRQPVEAVAADVEAVPPLGRHRVGGGLGRQRGVERGVEAGDGRHAGRRGGHGVEGGERLGLVQRGQGGERLEPAPHVVVDHDRLAEALAPVDDPVPDGVEAVPARRATGASSPSPSLSTAVQVRGADARRRRRPAAAASGSTNRR